MMRKIIIINVIDMQMTAASLNRLRMSLEGELIEASRVMLILNNKQAVDGDKLKANKFILSIEWK